MSNYPQSVQLGVTQSGDIYVAEMDRSFRSSPPRYHLVKISPGGSPFTINTGSLEGLRNEVSRVLRDEQVRQAARMSTSKGQKVTATIGTRSGRTDIAKILLVLAAMGYFLFHKLNH
jgi:hypothetical protein